MTSIKKISIVVPLYNEEESLEQLSRDIVRSADLLDLPYEVILINDGSIDATRHRLENMARKTDIFKVINLRRNFGQTAAMMAGIDFASGDIVITMDGDLQNDPNDISKLIQKLDEGYDVCSGWRKDRKDKLLARIIPSKIANWLISKISGVRLKDYGCTLKAYRKDVLQDIRLYGEMHRFIPICASWQGAKVTEVPVTHRARRFGKSKYGLERHSDYWAAPGVARPPWRGSLSAYTILTRVLSIWGVGISVKPTLLTCDNASAWSHKTCNCFTVLCATI